MTAIIKAIQAASVVVFLPAICFASFKFLW
jgi:hypothetical protein